MPIRDRFEELQRSWSNEGANELMEAIIEATFRWKRNQDILAQLDREDARQDLWMMKIEWTNPLQLQAIGEPVPYYLAAARNGLARRLKTVQRRRTSELFAEDQPAPKPGALGAPWTGVADKPRNPWIVPDVAAVFDTAGLFGAAYGMSRPPSYSSVVWSNLLASCDRLRSAMERDVVLDIRRLRWCASSKRGEDYWQRAWQARYCREAGFHAYGDGSEIPGLGGPGRTGYDSDLRKFRVKYAAASDLVRAAAPRMAGSFGADGKRLPVYTSIPSHPTLRHG